MSEPSHSASDEEVIGVDEATVVVERARQVDDATVVVERARPVDEETVVVERGRHVDEETVVVDRDAHDRTVVIERPSREADEATVVVDRKAASSDETVAVGKRANAKAPPSLVPRGRQRINLPPVEPGFAEQAVIAAGPGAVENYAPRQIPLLPLPAIHAEKSVGVERPPAEAVPSVRKSSRRFGIVAIFGFVVACAISIAGLGAIVFTVLRGL